MWILWKNIRIFIMEKFFISMILLFPVCAWAQSSSLLKSNSSTAPGVPSPALSQKSAPINVTQSQQFPGSGGGIFESGTLERMSDKVFDVNKDSFNLENGQLHWKGKTFDIGNSRLVKSRFERYLSIDADLSEYAKYQSILNEIFAQLSAVNDRLPPEKIRYMWTKLFDAAEFECDGGGSLLIANVVYLSMRMKNEYKFYRMEENRKLLEANNAKEIAKNQAKFMEYASDKEKQRFSGSVQRKAANARTQGTTESAYALADYQKELAEFATATATKEAVAMKAITQFQSQAYAFALSRKFQQAQVACMFYRHLYRGNAQEIIVGKDQFQDFFKVSNLTPTMEFLESFAVDARRDVRDGMKSVESLYNAGDRYSALQRLMETFILGEYDPEVYQFDPEKRKVLLKIYRNAATIKELADSKDWGGIEEIIKDINSMASDFPSREILAKVRSAQQASNMYVTAAKQSAALGKTDDVAKNLEKAAELWPLNPEITKFNNDLIGLSTGMIQYAQKFDQLYESGNYREIANEAPEYAATLRNDAERSKKLRDIVVKIGQIDMVLAQVAELEKQNNPYFAWDLLENARQIEPSDPVLARAIAKLAPEVSDYVKVLSDAKKAENEKKYAEALNYYLAAQMIFPASRACRLGIERTAPMYIY